MVVILNETFCFTSCYSLFIYLLIGAGNTGVMHLHIMHQHGLQMYCSKTEFRLWNPGHIPFAVQICDDAPFIFFFCKQKIGPVWQHLQQ